MSLLRRRLLSMSQDPTDAYSTTIYEEKKKKNSPNMLENKTHHIYYNNTEIDLSMIV